MHGQALVRQVSYSGQGRTSRVSHGRTSRVSHDRTSRFNAALPFVSQWKSYGNGKQMAWPPLPFVSQWKSYGNGKQMAWPPKRTSSDLIDVPLAFLTEAPLLQSFGRTSSLIVLTFERIVVFFDGL
jgi:hypothetical protein